MDYDFQTAASLLGISPKLLLSWSQQFAALLSDSAHDMHASERYYTQADIAVLQRAKTLLSNGYSYVQVRSQLSAQQPPSSANPPAQNQTIAPPAEDVAPSPRDTATLAPVPPQQAPHQPIDQFRSYLRQPETRREPAYLANRPWTERFLRDLLRWVAIILGVCLIAILIGTGVVFLTTRPAFNEIGRNSGTPTVVLTQLASNSGGVAAIQTPAPSESGTANEPGAAAPSSQAALEAPSPPSSLAIVPTVAATLQPMTVQPKATAVETSVQPSRVAPSALPPTPTTAATTTISAPTDVAPSSAAILQRLAAAESALHSGQFEATIDYGAGNRSSTQVLFDTGDGQRPPAFQVTSTYEGSSGAQTTRRITIGDHLWEQQPDGSWTQRAAQEGIVDQINVFLPHTEAITDTEITTDSSRTILRWYDASRDVDVTLTINSRTGAPLELHELTRSTGAMLTVSYNEWNTPVDITPPK